MSEYSLRGVEWGSKEFVKIMEKAKREEAYNEDVRVVDEMLRHIKTRDGHRYLIDCLGN